MCLQLVLQMQHTDYSNLNQSGVHKESSLVAVLSASLPPPNKSASAVELLVFCIHLFSIQTFSAFQSTSFSGIRLFSSLSFLIIVGIGKIYPLTVKSLLSALPLHAKGTLFQYFLVIARSH